MKKLFTFIAMLIIAAIFGGTTVYAKGAQPKITVNNKEIKYDVYPYMNGKELMLPVKKTVETLGARVEYDKKANLVRIEMDNKRIELPVGKKEFYIYKNAGLSGKRQVVKLGIKIKREKGITFIEGKKFFESLGISVKWDSKKKIFKIIKADDIDLTKDIRYTVITKDNIKDIKPISKWYEDNYRKSGIYYKKHGDVMYVLIGAGKKATGGYSVGIDKISYKNDKTAYVYAYVKKPSADMMVIQAETYPHMLIKIADSKKLNKVEGTVEEKADKSLPAKVAYQEITFDYIKYNDTLVKWYNENNQKKGISYTRLGNYIYILIGAGQKSTGGYSIRIDDALLNSADTVTIKARVIPPESNANVIMMITYPSKFIRIESTAIKNVIGDITDTTKTPVSDKWISLDSKTVSRMELLDLDFVKIRDITGAEQNDIIKSFNEAAVDDSFYIMMITGKVLKVTTTDGYVITFTSYGSENNVVAAVEKGQEVKTFHLVAPVIARLLINK